MSASDRVVVTGAAGFIGSHLAERLLGDGCEVLGIDSFEDYYDVELKRRNVGPALEDPAYELLEADLVVLGQPGDGSSAPLVDLLDGAEAVYHLAAQAGVRRSWGGEFDIYTRNNVLATQVLLEAALEAGVPKVVYGSSSSVYGDTDRLPMIEDAACWPHSPYGVTKLAAEHLCGLYMRNFGLPTASFRFFTVYGPRQRPDMAFNIFMRAILDGEPVRIFGDGAQTRDFTYVSDIVDGLLLGLDPDVTGVYNLGGGSRVSLSEAVSTIETVAGAPVSRTDEPTQAGDVRDTWASLDRAGGIGYGPQVALDEGLRREWEWMLDLDGRKADEAGPPS